MTYVHVQSYNTRMESNPCCYCGGGCCCCSTYLQVYPPTHWALAWPQHVEANCLHPVSQDTHNAMYWWMAVEKRIRDEWIDTPLHEVHLALCDCRWKWELGMKWHWSYSCYRSPFQVPSSSPTFGDRCISESKSLDGKDISTPHCADLVEVIVRKSYTRSIAWWIIQ